MYVFSNVNLSGERESEEEKEDEEEEEEGWYEFV